MQKQTVIISGGSSGIGKQIVSDLLNLGYNVACFSSNRVRIEKLSKELNNFKDSLFTAVIDIKKPQALKSFVNKTLKKFGSIDILINNAGVGYFSPPDKLDLKNFNEMLDVNVKGLIILTSLVIPLMKKQRQGLIINIDSIAGKKVFPQGQFYSASKFAVAAYTEGLRNELQEWGIKVSMVCPGLVNTDFFNRAKDMKRRMKMWNNKIPTMLEAKDISQMIVYLCQLPKHVEIQEVIIMPK